MTMVLGKIEKSGYFLKFNIFMKYIKLDTSNLVEVTGDMEKALSDVTEVLYQYDDKSGKIFLSSNLSKIFLLGGIDALKIYITFVTSVKLSTLKVYM